MERFCVFCGESPEEKNKEHVLPAWLIELTGDPKRIAVFGIDFNRDFTIRKFSFDAFVFPACTACNSAFGQLEQSVKQVIVKMVAHQPLSANDLILLLDWLDKVRVGLWLGYPYLNKNLLGIKPRFHIESRIGRADRMATILHLDDADDGLTFVGPEFMSYQLSPTCFGLRINGVCIINASGISLCSRRLGFPYLQPLRVRDDRELEAIPKFGSARVMNPVERISRLPRSVSVYQPIFRGFLDLDNGKQYLANEWVSEHTADATKGHGTLFIQRADSVEAYGAEPSVDWICTEKWSKSEMGLIAEHVHNRMRRDFEVSIRLVSSKEGRKQLRTDAVMVKQVDKAMLLSARQHLRDLDLPK